MKTRLISILLTHLPILISAQQKNTGTRITDDAVGRVATNKVFTIDGYIKGMEHGMIKLSYYKSEGGGKSFLSRDSVEVTGGHFYVKGSIDKPTYCLLENMKYLYQIHFWLDSTAQQFEGAIDNDDFQVTSSPTQDEDNLFHTSYDAYSDQIATASFELSGAKKRKESSEVIERNQKKLDSVIDIRKEFAARFVQAHPNSQISMTYMFNCTSPGNEAYAEKVFSYLTEELRQSESGKKIIRKLAAIRGTTVGNLFPDFEQPDPEGKGVKVSNFRGKYLLLRVASSGEQLYASPMNDSAGLKSYYNLYGPKGFAVVDVVTAAKDRDALAATVQLYKIPWIVLSDFTNVSSPVLEKLNLTHYPTWYLIDPKGILIARDLTMVGLSDKLNEIFK